MGRPDSDSEDGPEGPCFFDDNEAITLSHAGGEFIAETFYPGGSQSGFLPDDPQMKRKREERRTRRDRTKLQVRAFELQMECLVDAYMLWRASFEDGRFEHAGPPPTGPPLEDSAECREVQVLDVFRLYVYQVPVLDTDKTTICAFIRNGLIPSAPYNPHYAVSVRALEVFRTVHLRCPHLAVEPFVKSLCDLYGIAYRPALRKTFSTCYDTYLRLRDESEMKVKRALNRTGIWRRKNACSACTYELTDEEKLTFRMLVAMDGNDSLKRVLRKALDPSYDEDEDETPASTFGTQREDPREVSGDIYLTNDQVNAVAPEADADDLLKDIDDGNPCASRWKNMDAEKTSKMWRTFDESGVFLCICRHGFALVVLDMVQSGELSKYPLAVVKALLDAFGDGIGAGYDIGCRFATTLRQSTLGRRAKDANYTSLVGSFHGHAHNRLCQLSHLATYVPGLGLEDLEGCERFFSKSNALATAVRYASTFHRRQEIEQYIKHVDQFETAHNISKFLVDNYKQALDLISGEAGLRIRMAARGILSGDAFKEWLAQEREYLTSLAAEPVEETLQMEYYQRLVDYEARREHLEKLGPLTFIIYDPSQPKSISGSGHYIKRRQAEENFQKARDLVQESERVLNVVERWTKTSAPYLQAAELVRRRRYQRCLDELERLVVQRIFELTKMNRSQTGYKMRKKVAQALQARSQGVKSALDKYNDVAKSFNPPKRTLTWDEVVEYAFLSDFDLLRDSRQDIRDRPWAQPLNRALMDEWFRIERAREEIQRLNIEIRRVITHLHDEQAFLTSSMQAALSSNPPDLVLAFHIRLYQDERGRYNSIHLDRFKKLANLPGFTGSLTPGISVDPTLRSKQAHQNSLAPAPSSNQGAANMGSEQRMEGIQEGREDGASTESEGEDVDEEGRDEEDLEAQFDLLSVSYA